MKTKKSAVFCWFTIIVIVLVGCAVSTPTATSVPPTDTPVPAPPTEIVIGGYVQIVNTDGAGLSLRAGPGSNNARLVVADADSVLAVIGGPNDDEQGETDDSGNVHKWWFLRHPDGTEGWGRADFLAPSSAPQE